MSNFADIIFPNREQLLHDYQERLLFWPSEAKAVDVFFIDAVTESSTAISTRDL
jgi:hypothetical protein